MEVAIVFISLFIVVFGILYLYYSTRHKERLALIEKGQDVSVFMSAKTPSTISPWKIISVNLALISIGVGTGILFGSFLYNVVGMQEEVAYSASIFLLAGAGLLIGALMAKKEESQG